MEFGQLIEYNKISIFFFQNHAENELRRLVPDLSLSFLKGFISGKCKWCAVWFHYISIVLRLAYNKNELYETLGY